MTITIEQLPDDIEALKEIIFSQRSEIQLKNQKIQYLLEQFNLLRHKQFASSSEASPDQISLFDEAEQEQPSAETQTQTIAEHPRKKPVRKPLPQDLPRETVVVDLSEAEKVCDCCGGALHEMGKETREQLEFIPAQITVVETVRLKYSCRRCDQEGTEGQIKIAPAPTSPIPKGIATASLLAYILISKYQYALPLYRLEQMFANYGIEISRKTMADWVIRCAELLKPLFDYLKNTQLKQPILHADETPVQVIHNDKQKSYMWVYCTGTDSPHPVNSIRNIVLYDFQPSRSAQCVQNYLSDYAGYLQVDGYAAYEHTSATLVGCMAHVRRKFIEAQKAQPNGKTGKADWAINRIQKLYAIESQSKELTPEARHQQRQEKALPLLVELKEWVDKSLLTVPPKTALGTALAYTAKQWPKVIRYTEDGRLNIDNNRAERAIKPFVIGRKNWLFSNTERGAGASAVIYSIIETAKANGINTDAYLKMLLEELPKRQQGQAIGDLAPWAFKG
jgi:transposase